MPANPIPHTIRQIVDALGTSLSGALVYIGFGRMIFVHPDRDKDRECRPSFTSLFEAGGVLFDVGIQIPCNGEPGEDWTFYVTYEPDDTYSVRLLRTVNGVTSMMAEFVDVYVDSLKDIVESAYDNAIKEYRGGFIHI